jgi:hypothetical protein
MNSTENQVAQLPVIAEGFRTEIFGYIRSKVADNATAEGFDSGNFRQSREGAGKRN